MRLRILTWHVHGAYLDYLAHVGHEIVVPVKEGRPPRYGGRSPGRRWPPSLVEVPAEEVHELDLDCLLFQAPENYLEDQFEILSEGQRRLPRIYLEHDPPGTDRAHYSFSGRHPAADDPDLLLVHVTHFNDLMWDAGRTSTRVIEHGVPDPGHLYRGELERGITVVNDLVSRGRRLGRDVFERARSQVPLDLVGMGSEEAGGLGEVPQAELADLEAAYRFFFHPIRYTSLGLAACEAMMIGMPVVALATTEMPAVIIDGEDGFLGTDVGRLIEVMRELLEDRDRALRVGRAARSTALERFHLDRFVRDWEALLEEVAGRRLGTAVPVGSLPPGAPHEGAGPVGRRSPRPPVIVPAPARAGADEQLAWRSARRILAVRLDNLGDVLMLGPALAAVKERLPGVRLTLLGGPGGSQAAALLPWVDEVLTWRAVWQDLSGRTARHPDRERRLIDRLRAGRFDAALVFTSFSQSPHPPAYACYLAGIPLRAGESKEFGGALLTSAPPPSPDGLHQVDRNLRLVEWLGFVPKDHRLSVSIPQPALGRARALLSSSGVSPDQGYVVLSPWTSCQARTYPSQRFAAAASLVSEATGWPVVVTGAASEAPASRRLASRLPVGADLTGRTDVGELAALVSGARLVLSNNSFAMHVADATGTPVAVTYSGTDLESQWRPRHAPSVLLRRGTWCSPCYRLTCPYDRECLDMSPEEVAGAALQLLAGRAGLPEPDLTVGSGP